jgi:hypothetical protein
MNIYAGTLKINPVLKNKTVQKTVEIDCINIL